MKIIGALAIGLIAAGSVQAATKPPALNVPVIIKSVCKYHFKTKTCTVTFSDGSKEIITVNLDGSSIKGNN